MWRDRYGGNNHSPVIDNSRLLYRMRDKIRVFRELESELVGRWARYSGGRNRTKIGERLSQIEVHITCGKGVEIMLPGLLPVKRSLRRQCWGSCVGQSVKLLAKLGCADEREGELAGWRRGSRGQTYLSYMYMAEEVKDMRFEKI